MKLDGKEKQKAKLSLILKYGAGLKQGVIESLKAWKKK